MQNHNGSPSGNSDIRLGVILKFGVLLIVIAVFLHAVTYVLYRRFAGYETNRDPGLTPLAPRHQVAPPEPRLQVTPTQDLREMRAAEDAVLKSYGWVDRNKGTVRIPIEQAMKLMAERGKGK